MTHSTEPLPRAPLLLVVVLALVTMPQGALGADYVPFLPDTTVFAPPFTGQVHHFVSPGQCLDVTMGNLEDEDAFLGPYAQGALTGHLIQRMLDAWWSIDIPEPHLVAAVAAGWSFPESLTVTFAIVDTSGPETAIYPLSRTFVDPLPVFPDGDPQDTTAVQQVTVLVQFRADTEKAMQRPSSTGMVAETVTDPASRPTGTTTIDIFDVSDKWKRQSALPIAILFDVTNTGTGGVIGYQIEVTSLSVPADVPSALLEAPYVVRAQWEDLRKAVETNSTSILSSFAGDPQGKTPCERHGGLQVFVHNDGTTCDRETNNNCVIYGDGTTLGLPFPTSIALASLAARTAPGEIRVSWRAPESTGARFHVYRAETSRPELERRLTRRPLEDGPEFELVDREVAAGVEYAYTIGAVDPTGAEVRFGPVVARATPVVRLSLAQNAPNPFNPSTLIRFQAPAAERRTVLRVYDASGRAVRTLVDAFLAPGSYQVRWDGRDDAEREMASGVYIYAFDGDLESGRKMVLQK